MIAGDVDHDNSAARRLLGESLVLYRSLGFPRFIALVLLSLGTVALAEADLDRAHDMLQQSLTGMKQVGEKLGIHGALDTFGHLAITRGQTERAVRLAGAADRLRATSGTPLLARGAAHPYAMAGLSTSDAGRNGIPSRLGTGTHNEPGRSHCLRPRRDPVAAVFVTNAAITRTTVNDTGSTTTIPSHRTGRNTRMTDTPRRDRGSTGLCPDL
jgi:hypothetical protein